MNSLKNVVIVDLIKPARENTARCFDSSKTKIVEYSTLSNLSESAFHYIDAVFINISLLRNENARHFVKSLTDTKIKVALSPVPLLEPEIESLKSAGIEHTFTYPITQEHIKTLTNKTETSIFDLRLLTGMGLTQEEAINTASVALPDLKDAKTDLLTTYSNLDLKTLIEKIHRIHGLINYSGLIRLKERINYFELELKDYRDLGNLQATQLQLATVHDFVQLMEKDISHAEKELHDFDTMT